MAPEVKRKPWTATRTIAAYADPVDVRHRLQWQSSNGAMIEVASNWTAPHKHPPLIIGCLRLDGRLTFAFCRTALSAKRRGIGVGQQRAVRQHVSSAPVRKSDRWLSRQTSSAAWSLLSSPRDLRHGDLRRDPSGRSADTPFRRRPARNSNLRLTPLPRKWPLLSDLSDSPRSVCSRTTRSNTLAACAG